MNKNKWKTTMNKNSTEFLPDLALLEQKAAFGLHKITPAGQKKWLVFSGWCTSCWTHCRLDTVTNYFKSKQAWLFSIGHYKLANTTQTQTTKQSQYYATILTDVFACKNASCLVERLLQLMVKKRKLECGFSWIYHLQLKQYYSSLSKGSAIGHFELHWRKTESVLWKLYYEDVLMTLSLLLLVILRLRRRVCWNCTIRYNTD